MMDPIWQSTLEGYVKLLYDNDPQGSLLESIRDFEKRFCEIAQEHRGDPDVAAVLNQTGLQDEYNRLYMASINRNNDYNAVSSKTHTPVFDYQKEQRLPTVNEFLNNYRLVYEEIKPNARTATNTAYEKLFAVEQRTQDLFEAQMIIEREKLILNTIIADYKEIAEDFLKAADPNFEITSSVVKVSAGAYVYADSIDEITFMGEMARGKAEELAVQNSVKMTLFSQFMSLIYTWEYSKRKIRDGDLFVDKYAQSMVVTREKIRLLYRFMSQDMGIDFDKMENTPFYRIMLLDPKGLDELWRIKKVMHPDNIKATKYVLFEEILSEKTMEDILLSPQQVPYYEPIDTIHDVPTLDDEYLVIAAEMNKDISYFRRNTSNAEQRRQKRALKEKFSQKKLLHHMKQLNQQFLEGTSGHANSTNRAFAGTISSVITSTALGNTNSNIVNVISDMKEGLGQNIEKDTVSTVKEIGRGILRGLFRK